MSQTACLSRRLCRRQLAPEGVRLNVVSAGPLAVDLDDRDQFAVTLLELRVAVNRDLVELEAELVTELDKFSLRTFTQVTTCRRVEDNLRVMGRGHA